MRLECLDTECDPNLYLMLSVSLKQFLVLNLKPAADFKHVGTRRSKRFECLGSRPEKYSTNVKVCILQESARLT